jgi:hypothetical protein
VAAIDFYINAGSDFNLMLGGSGLGFYGSTGFGASVEVASYQGRTFVTDGNGVIQGPEGRNCLYLNPTGVIPGQAGAGIRLDMLPNYQSSLNIRFTHGSAVQTQNAKLRIYDRSNINLAATGVTTKVAEVIHPYVAQEINGSGDGTWITPAGSSVIVDLASSPGLSGWQAPANGAGNHTATRHDWYVAISASPDSIGSKTLYGLYFSTEYL